MAFIAIPMGSRDDSAAPSAFQIGQMGANGFEPVGMINFEPTLPIEGSKLAANLAALLNGNNPIYRFGGEMQMFFQRLASGRMAFNFRPVAEDGGVSKMGTLVTMFAGFEHLLDTATDPESKAFKLFMASGNEPERRSTPRSEASGGREHKPAPVSPPPSSRPSF